MRLVNIRSAKRDEQEWINQQYQSIHFAKSDFDREFLVVAECQGHRAGIGRLVTIDANTVELGGIYVLPEFRGQRIAEKIVQFLTDHIGERRCYCLPFEHLKTFYEKFGFELVKHHDQVPRKIIEKKSWCQETYPTPALLLERAP